MNIVIPMAGLGTRFPIKEYKVPKPLIDINGKPMIFRAVRSLGIVGKYFFIIPKNQFSQQIKEAISEIEPNSYVLEIDYTTDGPARTALLVEEFINNDEELIITNCDQIMEWNPQNFLHNIRLYDGGVVTYHTDTDKNSYAKIDSNGYVIEIKEKEVISNISLNGIHYWKKGFYFVNSAKKMISMDDRAPNGEFYIGPSYNYMTKNNLSVGIYHIPNQQHHPVGVPYDLERYLIYEKSKIR